MTMSQKTKKILIIVSAALVLILIGLIIYVIFFKKETSVTPPAGTEEFPLIEEGAGPEAKERLIALTQESVLGAVLTKENKIFYVAWDGSIKQIAADGTGLENIGSLPQENIGEIIMSSTGNGLVVKQVLPSGTNRFVLFDVENKSLKSLPQNLETASFDPDGKQLVMSLSEKGASRLVTANIKDLKTQSLTTTKIPDLVLDWQKGFVALKTKSSGLAYGLLYTLDVKTKKIQRLLGNIYGLTAKISPSNKKILYSETNSDGGNLTLKVLNLTKQTEQNLGVFSLPEKCVWAQDDRTLYCNDINTEDSFVMPDDYYKRKIGLANNDILKINLDTGESQKVISGGFDAVNLLLSPDNTYLFFINKIDGRLYRLTL